MPIKTLLVYDSPEWACHGTCKATKLQLDIAAPGRFDCTIVQANKSNEGKLAPYDLVFSTIYYHFAECNHPKATTQVSSYSYWIRKGWEGGWPHLSKWKYVVAKNQAIYDKLTPEDHPRITKLYHVFDHTFFTPGPAPKKPGVFTIGFAGHKQDLKGLKFIQRALERVKGVELKTATWEESRLPFSQMPAFYRSLDAYVSMSDPRQEAGPRPAIEAGLCGTPIIVTRAGQIGEMVTDGENALVVERTDDALVDALQRLKDDKALHAKIAKNIRPSFVQKWVLDVGQSWADYFTTIAETDSP